MKALLKSICGFTIKSLTLLNKRFCDNTAISNWPVPSVKLEILSIGSPICLGGRIWKSVFQNDKGSNNHLRSFGIHLRAQTVRYYSDISTAVTVTNTFMLILKGSAKIPMECWLIHKRCIGSEWDTCSAVCFFHTSGVIIWNDHMNGFTPCRYKNFLLSNRLCANLGWKSNGRGKYQSLNVRILIENVSSRHYHAYLQEYMYQQYSSKAFQH